MNDFTASNGMQIRTHPSIPEAFGIFNPKGDSTLNNSYDHLNLGEMQALREFFQAEADERYGVWRSPGDPDVMVYEIDQDTVRVLDPSSHGNAATLSRGNRGDGPLSRVAQAYFDAHPEPKPWHDAAPGEVWDVDLPSGGMRAVTFYSARHEEPTTVFRDAHTQVEIETDDPTIRDARCLFSEARRIWVEVSS